MRRNLILATAVAVLALAGVAQANGVLGGSGEPRISALQAKAERLEARLLPRRDGASTSARRGRRGPRGRRGRPGPQGARGPAGAKGSFSATGRYDSAPVFLCSFGAGTCAVGSAKVDCPPGTIVTGGGYTGAGILTTVAFSAPVGNGWAVIAVNFDEVPVGDLKAVAVCAAA